MEEDAEDVDAGAQCEPPQRHLKALTADDVGGRPVQGQRHPDEQAVPQRCRLLPVLVTEDVGLEHPQDAVGAVEGEVDPRRRVVPLVKVSDEGECREDGRTLMRVDEVLLFHGDLGSATNSANVDFLDGAVIGLVDRHFS